MIIINIISELIEIKSNIGLIDTSAINLNLRQQYVLDLKTEERITVFTGFEIRGSGQTWATILKAIQLSNRRRKDVLVLSGYSVKQVRYMAEEFETILEICDSEKCIVSSIRNGNQYIYNLTNGSTIRFLSGKSESHLRGCKADYVVADNMDIYDERLIQTINCITFPIENGQSFIFPIMRNERRMI